MTLRAGLPSGIVTALMCPFDADGDLDPAALQRLVDLQVQQGVAGLYVGGSSGEAMLQSVEERARHLRDAAEANANRLPLVAQIGAIATRDALVLADIAAAMGYHAISAVAPFYYGFSRAEVRAHYDALARSTDLPLIIYNFPAASTGFTLAEMLALLDHPGIAGVKHTSTDLFMLERLVAAGTGAIYNGYDEMCLAGLAMGAQGAIGTTYNFMGDLFVDLAGRLTRGDIAGARALQATGNDVIAVLVECGVLPAAKVILHEMGVDVGPTRLPFRPLAAEAEARVRDAARTLIAYRAARAA